MKSCIVLASALLLAAATSTYADSRVNMQIDNTATASFVDSKSVVRTTSSNTVTAAGDQVASVAMAAGVLKTVAKGGSAMLAHSLTNTGNRVDTFKLSEVNGGGFAMSGVSFYSDTNGYGIPDNAVPITAAVDVAPGATFYFVALATLPRTAATGSVNTLVLTATSVRTDTVSAISTDKITVGAVLDGSVR